jgi:uncharacterized membrane protein
MKRASLFIMAFLYVAAGINHFWHKVFYLKIMPPWLPWHNELVIISGICQILFGLLLLVPATQRAAAWCIILLLIAIFPANIYMAVTHWKESSPNLWITIIRLPLQIVLIWWAFIFTKADKINK